MRERIKNTLSIFQSRNYRLYFTGQSISLIGTWMQRTAVMWVIYTMTQSPLMLGVSVFMSQFPSFLLSLAGGIVSDRYNRYKVLLITQSAALVQAATLTILTLTHHNSVWGILSLSFMLGIINAFDVPARQPLVHEIINDKAELPRALAFNSSMVNLARLVGPALSGIVLEELGAGICFLVNALSFLAVILSLLLMKLPAYTPRPERKKAITDLTEGFAYLKRTPVIGITLLILTTMSFLVLPYNTLLPVFAKVIFKGDATTFGYINSFIGAGALTGAYFLASLKEGANYRKILLINTAILGVGLILFSQMHVFSLSMAMAVLCGFGTMSQTSICNIIIQMEADKHMRGRAISYVAMAAFGMLPLGSLITGVVSQKLGASATLLLQGFLALIIAGIFYRVLSIKHLMGSQKKLEKQDHPILPVGK